jgi:hypothetical protein
MHAKETNMAIYNGEGAEEHILPQDWGEASSWDSRSPGPNRVSRKRIYNFLTLHACFAQIYICSAHTLLHFFTFFGTNLLTRCQSASSLFSAVLYFRKVV